MVTLKKRKHLQFFNRVKNLFKKMQLIKELQPEKDREPLG